MRQQSRIASANSSLENRVGVGIAAGILVLLTAFGSAITLPRSETARERVRAERGSAWAERTAEFLMGAYSEADSLLRTAYQIRLDRLGTGHPWTQETAEHIGELYSAWGRNLPDGLVSNLSSRERTK